MAGQSMIEPTSSTPGSNPVTTREFEAYMKAQSNEATLRQQVLESSIASLSALVTSRFESRDKELILQAKEYERRLLDLNNSHDKALQVQSTYVNKESLRLETDDLKRRTDINVEAVNKITLEITKLTAHISTIESSVLSLVTSQTWITRLVAGAVITALIALVIGGRFVQ